MYYYTILQILNNNLQLEIIIIHISFYLFSIYLYIYLHFIYNRFLKIFKTYYFKHDFFYIMNKLNITIQCIIV